MKKTIKTKARKGILAMRRRHRKNQRRADQHKGVIYGDWFEQQVEALK